MKTIFKTFLTMCLALMLTPLASAYDFKVDDLCYNINIDRNTVSVTYQRDSEATTATNSYDLSGKVVIPDHVTYGHSTYRVTAIGKSAFRKSPYITDVYIPNSVTTIDDKAFQYCGRLESVTIPNSVTSIGYNAFHYTGLVSVSIPNSLITLSYDVFDNTPWYESQPAGAVYIEDWFYKFKGITPRNTFTINNGTKGIAGRAFYNGAIKGVIIPNSVKSINEQAFYGCSNLTDVTLDNSLDYLGAQAFYNTPWYSAFPFGEVYVGNWLCGYKWNPEEFFYINIVVKDGTKGIVDRFFMNRDDSYLFKSITIPNSVSYIGKCAFYHCYELENVTIGSSATSIGEYAFFGCINLKNISVDQQNPKYDSREDCNALILTASNTLLLGGKNTIIPNSITAINDYAFCNFPKSITIPTSVIHIAYNAIYCDPYYDELYDVYTHTDGLSTLTITGNGTWQHTSLGSFDIPYYITIGSGITSLCGCHMNPSGLSCYAAVPPTCDDETFSSYRATLNVPSTSTAAYFTAPYWQNFNNIQNTLTDVVELDRAEASVSQWDELQLTVTKKPSGSGIRWSSSDIRVATVDANGKVTAVGGGECDIFASAASKLAVYSSCHIISNYPEITLSIDKENVTIDQLGGQVSLVATITPGNTGLEPTWFSSAQDVATVDDNGTVTAMGEGECDITATVLDKSVTCHVIVSYPKVTLTLDKENVTIDKVGEQVTLVATVTPNDLGLTPSWASSAQSVATVDANGVVTATGKGECDIIATVLDKTATCHVTVNGIITIIIGRETANIKPNMLLTLSPMFDHEATSIVATSSDPGVVAVRVVNKNNAPTLAPVAGTQQVQMVGVTEGVATITIASVDGNATPATCIVTVTEFFIGDVNGDDLVNGADVTALYNAILNGTTPDGDGDVNRDGIVNGADVTALYNLLLN